MDRKAVAKVDIENALNEGMEFWQACLHELTLTLDGTGWTPTTIEKADSTTSEWYPHQYRVTFTARLVGEDTFKSSPHARYRVTWLDKE